MIFLTPFIWVVQTFSADIAGQTALAHFLFNVFNTLIFLVLLKPFERLIIKIVQGTEEEILFRTKYIKRNGYKKLKPKQKIESIKKEIAYSIENTIKIYQLAISSFYNPSNLTVMNIHKLETLNDYLDDETTECILELSKKRLGEKTARSTVTLIKVSNTIEQLGDLGTDFAQVFNRMHELGIPYREVDIERLTDIHNRLIELFRDIEKNIITTSEKRLANIKVKEEEIYNMIKEDFDTHVERLQKIDDYDGNIFVDAISVIELSVSKVRDIRKLLQKQIIENKS
jgi:Na+/phosphate symporter